MTKVPEEDLLEHLYKKQLHSSEEDTVQKGELASCA